MPLAKRIIPCLDVKGGRVVKGIKFRIVKDAGAPHHLAELYMEEGADELVFLDISASVEERKTTIKAVRETAQKLFIPLTVGGGISEEKDIKLLLEAGADKVSINTAAVKDPDLIKRSATIFGSQCIVVAIDAKKKAEGKWEVFIKAGTTPTGIDVILWAKRVESLGAGEILLTSIDKDGTKSGYDLELTKAVSESVGIPVIASGGAGTKEHFVEVFSYAKADAALAASIFHFGEIKIKELKLYLKENGIPVRL